METGEGPSILCTHAESGDCGVIQQKPYSITDPNSIAPPTTVHQHRPGGWQFWRAVRITTQVFIRLHYASFTRSVDPVA